MHTTFIGRIRLALAAILVFGAFTLTARAEGRVGRIDVTYGTMKEGEPYSTAGLKAVGSNGVTMSSYKYYCGSNQTTINREHNYISISFYCTQPLDRVDIYVNGAYCDSYDCGGNQPAVSYTIKDETGKAARYFPATVQLHHRVYSDGVYDEELFKDIVYSYYDGEPALPVTAPECPVTREGYIFSGWKQESKEETYMYSLPCLASGWRRYGIEYTAVWRKPLTITGETEIKKSEMRYRGFDFSVSGGGLGDELKGIAIDNINAVSGPYLHSMFYSDYKSGYDSDITDICIDGDALKELSAGQHTLTVYFTTQGKTVDKITHTFTVIDDLPQMEPVKPVNPPQDEPDEPEEPDNDGTGGSGSATTVKPAWKQDRRGWWYRRADGSYPRDTWEKIGGKWYHFDADGYMQTGWIKTGGKWYYLNGSGVMQTGWVKTGGKWYYLNGSGAMQKGWIKTGGKWYYLNGSGVMKTGWVKTGGKWYYLNGSGAMQKGWIKTGGKWYYLNGSGAMLADTTRTIGGKRYSFRKNGVCIIP